MPKADEGRKAHTLRCKDHAFMHEDGRQANKRTMCIGLFLLLSLIATKYGEGRCVEGASLVEILLFPEFAEDRYSRPRDVLSDPGLLE